MGSRSTSHELEENKKRLAKMSAMPASENSLSMMTPDKVRSILGHPSKSGGVSVMRQNAILQMQQRSGNRAVQRLLATVLQRHGDEEEGVTTDPESAQPGEGQVMECVGPKPTLDTGEKSDFDEMDGEITSDVMPHAFMDGGKIGSAPLHVAGPSTNHRTITKTAQSPAQKDESRELDGQIDSADAPHAFVDGGKTGVAAINWVGGTGGAGNQGVGSITLVAPIYEAADPAVAGGTATAWIRVGTGKATVTRSFTGALSGGANGGGYFLTARALARTDTHERNHVASSRAIHDTFIAPLELRVAQRTGQAKALASGADQAAAIAALRALIRWDEAVNGFITADTASNTPGGTLDTTDAATADFYRNYGPRKVAGVDYASYIDTPPGP